MKLVFNPWIVRTCFATALVIATYPAWSVVLLGSEPTFNELLELICSVPQMPRTE
jgi:hypothetical protein